MENGKCVQTSPCFKGEFPDSPIRSKFHSQATCWPTSPMPYTPPWRRSLRRTCGSRNVGTCREPEPWRVVHPFLQPRPLKGVQSFDFSAMDWTIKQLEKPTNVISKKQTKQTNKTNKQTNKQPTNQASKQASKQTPKLNIHLVLETTT